MFWRNLLSSAHRFRGYLAIGVLVFWSCAYFFQGGGWNQSAHLATLASFWEDGTLLIDKYSRSTGDVAKSKDGIVSVKPIGTAILASPGFILADLLTKGVNNKGNKFILRSYLTTLFSAGVAFTLAAIFLLGWFRRRLSEPHAFFLTMGMCLGTPLWPNSTMLTQTAFVTLFLVLALRMLDSLSENNQSPYFFGILGIFLSIPAGIEHTDALILFPIGIYVFWKARSVDRILAFLAGVALVAAVPLTHHWIVYGHPLSLGYHKLTVKAFNDNMWQGFVGYGMPKIETLYYMTFGVYRGYFFLSPFLIGMVPGFLRMMKEEPHKRGFALSTFVASWMLMIAVSSLSFWYSGDAVGSRYAYIFIIFSSTFLVVIYPHHRLWMNVGISTGLFVGFLATSVTALPPSFSSGPYNVVGYWFQQLSRGNIPSIGHPSLEHSVVGTGHPTLPFAFNLGQLMGLKGSISILPYLCVVVFILGAYIWSLRNNPKQS